MADEILKRSPCATGRTPVGPSGPPPTKARAGCGRRANRLRLMPNSIACRRKLQLLVPGFDHSLSLRWIPSASHFFSRNSLWMVNGRHLALRTEFSTFSPRRSLGFTTERTLSHVVCLLVRFGGTTSSLIFSSLPSRFGGRPVPLRRKWSALLGPVGPVRRAPFSDSLFSPLR